MTAAPIALVDIELYPWIAGVQKGARHCGVLAKPAAAVEGVSPLSRLVGWRFARGSADIVGLYLIHCLGSSVVSMRSQPCASKVFAQPSSGDFPYWLACAHSNTWPAFGFCIRIGPAQAESAKAARAINYLFHCVVPLRAFLYLVCLARPGGSVKVA